MADTPYNFLLIMTDQQHADHLSCYGNTVLATPNLDRIAAGGVRFERFYVANPVWMPNRATLTGRLPSNHGVRYNGLPLPAVVGSTPCAVHEPAWSDYDGFPFGELYNLVDDLLEHRNLWQVPEAQAMRAALSEQLLRTIIAQQDRSPLPEYLA